MLTNKYAEGYPGKRYYGGCEFVDQAETWRLSAPRHFWRRLCQRAAPLRLSANIAVFQALLKPGDTVLGMSLADGGHLTHGASVNFSGKIYQAVQYGIDHDTGLIDYDALRELPSRTNRSSSSAFLGYSRILDWSKFRKSPTRSVPFCWLIWPTWRPGGGGCIPARFLSPTW